MARWPVALLTGASSGIGRSIAEQLAAELRAAHGVTVEVLVADVAEPDQLALVEDRLRAGVDLLVNNAGAGGQGPFADIPVDNHDQRIRLNVVAPVRLTHAALEAMVPRKSGGILNVSSIAGRQPMPYVATYAATKAYLTAFSNALHEEVRGHGIAVTNLLPGFTRTEFHGAADINRSFLPEFAWMKADNVARAGLQAGADGRAQCGPGLGYRFLAGLSGVTPWSVSRRLLGRVLR